MPSAFTERLCAAVRTCDGGDAAMRALIGRAIVDTLGVAAAGFVEPVTRLALDAYRGNSAATWSGTACESEEAAVMIDAIAAHALDFDDVFLDSAIHPSTVILPAILRSGRNHSPDDIVAAFGAGLIAAQAVAARVGLGHYHKGWHGTGTIGAFAAAAAAGRLRKLDERQLATMFSIVASQSAGLKINFGTMTKPAHAGFAAAAGVRAAHLAQAGFTAAADIFGPGGYAELYGTPDGREQPADDAYRLRADKIALKLYPCCYATHRLIGIALDARNALGGIFSDERIQIRVTVPKGSIDVLRYDRPRTGLEAKFSAPYSIAVALLDGLPTLDHFTDEATSRVDVTACMERTTIVQDGAQESGGDIEFGTVILDVIDSDSATRGRFTRRAIPGSPDDPPSAPDVAAKFASVTPIFERAFGTLFPILQQATAIAEVRPWLQDADNNSPNRRAAGGR
jgi:2-methylcitrate dehydratase PrpD